MMSQELYRKLRKEGCLVTLKPEIYGRPKKEGRYGQELGGGRRESIGRGREGQRQAQPHSRHSGSFSFKIFPSPVPGCFLIHGYGP